MERIIILDVFLFDQSGDMAVVKRDSTDIYEKDVVSPIILTLPIDHHPVKFLLKYMRTKELEINSLNLLPAIYQNKFDSEPDREYLVLSFTAKCQRDLNKATNSDPENKSIVWMPLTQFANHPKLMPELKRSNFAQILDGKNKFYQGYYRDSDGSNAVLGFDEIVI